MKGFVKPHVVAVPFMALGHSIPFFDLARLLASNGLTVSYVTTSANVPRLEQSIREAVSKGLDIRLVLLPVESLPEGRETLDLLPPQSTGLLFQSAEKLVEPFSCWLQRQLEQESQEQTPPPVCVIHDLFIGWAVDVAEKYKIPSVLFNSCGAFAISLLHSVSCSILQNALEKEGDGVVLSLNLPRSIRLYKHEIATGFLEPGLSNPIQEFAIRRFQAIGKSSGMLINTFQELEPEYLKHLKNVTGKPVWAIGPTLPPDYLSGAATVSARGKVADISEEELVRWLDSQNPRSVVYVSFGSQTFLSEEQSRALARGLEGSGNPFVWVIKVFPRIEPATSNPTDMAARYLPESFQERTKDRGLVIWGWAPQLLTLSHPSVGAFMSHCGWNSTLESLTHGVPLIAWPMYGDQHFDSKLIAELGVGIQFCQHKDGIPDEQRVKEVVRLVLNEERGKEMKTAAEKLKEMARKAGDDRGSSKADLQIFVSHVHILNMTRVNSKRELSTILNKSPVRI